MRKEIKKENTQDLGTTDPKELTKYIIEIGLVGKMDLDSYVKFIEEDKTLIEDLIIKHLKKNANILNM